MALDILRSFFRQLSAASEIVIYCTAFEIESLSPFRKYCLLFLLLVLVLLISITARPFFSLKLEIPKSDIALGTRARFETLGIKGGSLSVASRQNVQLPIKVIYISQVQQKLKQRLYFCCLGLSKNL